MKKAFSQYTNSFLVVMLVKFSLGKTNGKKVQLFWTESIPDKQIL